jgi:MraZ protein
MLLGTAHHTIDEKGRLTLSTKWRSELESRVVVTRGLDKCLFILPESKFEHIAREIEAQGVAKADVRGFSRLVAAMAEIVEPDKQGRIIIPQNLREFAGLDGNVVVIGVLNHLEVWNPDAYKEVNAKVEADAEAVAERYDQIIRSASAKSN